MKTKTSNKIWLDEYRYLQASVTNGNITISKIDAYEDEGWKLDPEITMSLEHLKQLLDDLK